MMNAPRPSLSFFTYCKLDGGMDRDMVLMVCYNTQVHGRWMVDCVFRNCIIAGRKYLGSETLQSILKFDALKD